MAAARAWGRTRCPPRRPCTCRSATSASGWECWRFCRAIGGACCYRSSAICSRRSPARSAWRSSARGWRSAAESARVAAERESLRNTLLASISHDLRTPLAVMAGAGSTLAEHGAALDDATRRQLARSIETTAREMSELVSNVLDLMRFDSGEIDAAAGLGVPRRPGRRRARAMRAARSASIRVEVAAARGSAAGVRRCDADRAGVRESASTTPPSTRRRERGSRVTARDEGAFLHVMVDDDGPGLPPGDPERLFDKFQRGRRGRHDRRRRARARDLPRDHPRARRHDRRASAARRRRAFRVHVAHDGAGRVTDAMHQMLVVEDDAGIRNVLRVLLEGRELPRRRGGRPRASAKSRRASHKPDLLLVDLGLPDGDGLDVIQPRARMVAGAHHRAVGAHDGRRRRSPRSMRAPTTT